MLVLTRFTYRARQVEPVDVMAPGTAMIDTLRTRPRIPFLLFESANE